MAAAGLLLTGTLLLAPLSMTRVAFQTRVRNDLTILVLTVNSILWTAAVVAIAATDGGMVWFAAAFLASAVCSVGLGAVARQPAVAPAHARLAPSLA